MENNLRLVSAMGLINIHEMDNGEQVVMGRELHEKLEIGTPFKKWIDRMCEYGFLENIDFITVGQKCPIANGGFQEQKEYVLKLDMAKQIAMIQRSEKGKQLREYFLDLEKAWNSPEQVMARALQMAERVQNELRLQLSEAKPKVEYFDKVLDSASCFTTTQIAKEIQMTARMLNTVLANNGVQFKQSNQWQLTVEYQGYDYTKVRTSLDAKGNTHHTTVWTEKGREFVLNFMENV